MIKKIIFLICFSMLYSPFVNAAVKSPAAAKKTDRKTTIPAKQAKIKITVSFQAPGKKPVPLNKLDIFLCAESLKEEITGVRKTGKLLATKIGEYKALSKDLRFMAGKAHAAKVTKAITNAQGKCTLKNISPGTYVLYAGYKDESVAGYWLVPVVMSDTNKIHLNLTAQNMQENKVPERFPAYTQ